MDTSFARLSPPSFGPARPTSLSAARRAAAAGVTLVEVMIVVVIMGLIATGVAVAVFPKLSQAKIETTRNNAIELRRAAEQWRGLQGGDKCPTPQLLIQDKAIDSASKITDAWDQPFKVMCEEEETIVLSMGPDKKEGTGDDIRVPMATLAK